MVQAVLNQLDVWFAEPSQGPDRPKLLSKLAVLELCGWIEGEQDRQVLLAQSSTLIDEDWVKLNVIQKNFGFTYGEHFRVMMCKIFGELLVRRVEFENERAFPGSLDQLKSLLGTLWKLRCDYAHADVVANVASQKTFNAPSWAINQHRIVAKLLNQYEQSTKKVLSAL
jgi:hypothetical protein